MEEIVKDSRFSNLGKDPRFRKMQNHQRKVKIDKRFQSMFKDKKFKMKYSVDKRGRPVDTSTNENLKKFYELSSDESEASSEDETTEVVKSKDNKKLTKPQETTVNKKPKNIVKGIDTDVHITSKVSAKSPKKQTKVSKSKHLKKEVKGKLEKSSKTAPGSSEDIKSSELDSDSQSEVCEAEKDSESESEVCEAEKDSDSESGSCEADEDGEQQSDHTDSEEEVEESDSQEEDGIVISTDGPDYARGEGLIESSSEEESEDEIKAEEEEEKESKEIEHAWGELDKETGLTQDISSRLAVCNMDWDRIKANDILVLLNSFKPSEGTIKSVHVYPSEFGMQRMAEEDLKGPTEIVEQKDMDHSNSEASEFQREKLREYQLKRLKYYYAVVQCDNSQTANHIYDQCDGLEYESTSNRLDLRFIPDDMEFEQEAKSVATDVPNVALYQPKNYVTSALQQSKVQCTWDETDHDRLAVTMRKFNKDELEEMDLKDYIASDSDGEPAYNGEADQTAEIGGSESEEEQVNKYRKLLQGLNDKDKKEEQDIDMEITWEPGLKGNTEKLVNQKAKEDLTPWENYLDKKKEKKKLKKEKRKQATDPDPKDTGSIPDNSDSDVPSDVDLNDPYFKEELERMDKTDEKQKTKQGSKKDKNRKKKLSPEEKKEKEEREAELKLLLMDEDDQRQHFNLKQLMAEDTKQMSKTKRKKLKKKKQQLKQDEPQYADNFELEVGDPRFKELFENPHYNIDPSAPEFKKTKAVDLLIDEKQKRAKRKTSGRLERSEESGRLGKKQKLTPVIKERSSGSVDYKQNECVVGSSPMIGDKQTRTSKEDLATLIKSIKAKTEVLEKRKKKRKL